VSRPCQNGGRGGGDRAAHRIASDDRVDSGVLVRVSAGDETRGREPYAHVAVSIVLQIPDVRARSAPGGARRHRFRKPMDGHAPSVSRPRIDEPPMARHASARPDNADAVTPWTRTMPDQRAESLFLAHLEWIDRVSASLCRRHGIDGADAEDAAAWVRMRLIEDDYAALRRFRGESTPRTYLTVVVSMLFRDYRAARWGRWRASAEALRRGPVAVRLEAMVHRDGLRVTQAAEALRVEGHPEMSDGACARLLAVLPDRVPLRPELVGVLELVEPVDPRGADTRVQAREAAARRAHMERVLEDALEALPGEDRLIVRLRYWQGLTIAEVARALATPQKPLYRRIDRVLRTLRDAMARAGIGPADVGELLTEVAGAPETG
jgi:RNA polymerase sigma factor (sigma-70 family)